MLNTAFAILTVAVLLGAALAGQYLRGGASHSVPWPFAALHGLIGPSVDQLQAFRRGLAEFGYAEGKNVAIVYHRRKATLAAALKLEDYSDGQ